MKHAKGKHTAVDGQHNSVMLACMHKYMHTLAPTSVASLSMGLMGRFTTSSKFCRVVDESTGNQVPIGFEDIAARAMHQMEHACVGIAPAGKSIAGGASMQWHMHSPEVGRPRSAAAAAARLAE